MSLASRVARTWLPLAVVTTLLSGLLYVAVQQSYRNAADDPQIQMPEDGAAALADGADPGSVVGSATVNIATSLAPFTIVFDSSGAAVAGSARLDGRIPSPPKGVLVYARQHSSHRVTWQPRRGVRIASVTVAVDGGRGGYVFTGRSLREAERRVSELGAIVGLGWLATLGASLVAVVGVELLWRPRS